jgi:hypothetical protein
MTDTLSLLLPTRKRPQTFIRALDSVAATVARPALLEVVIGIDLDDDAAASLLDVGRYPFPIKVVRRDPRDIMGVGHKSEILRAEARDSDLVAWLADDSTITTPGWDDAARDAAAALPNRIGMLHLPTPVNPQMACFPLLTRETIAELGFLMEPWTPYWFCDTWLTEIGDYIGTLRPIAAEVICPDGLGQTRGMRELDFWCDWFDRMRPHRLATAERLLAKMYPDRPDLAAAQRAQFPMQAARHRQYMAFVLRNHAAIEKQMTMAEDRPLLSYVRCKQQALAMVEALGPQE